MKVMVIDDNSDIVFSVQKALETKKYEVIGATSGKEALKLISQDKPDLILLDIMMPEMNGWDVLAKIREKKEWEGIPVFFLTAKDDAITKGFAALSVDNYIVKPVNLDELDKKIKGALQ